MWPSLMASASRLSVRMPNEPFGCTFSEPHPPSLILNKPDSKPLPQALGVALLLVLGGLHALSFSIGPLPSWILPFYQITLLAIALAVLLVLARFHALSFSIGPLPSWVLPFYQIALLAIACSQIMGSTSVRQAFGRSYLFGLGHFGVGTYWLYISMHQYGGMPS